MSFEVTPIGWGLWFSPFCSTSLCLLTLVLPLPCLLIYSPFISNDVLKRYYRSVTYSILDPELTSLDQAQLGLGKQESAEVPSLVRSKVSFEFFFQVTLVKLVIKNVADIGDSG